MTQQEIYLNQFNKIQLLNHIADQIGNYGVQCGLEKLMEAMDMNCGAVPDGEFQQIIDPASPEQFLSMYTQIAQKRFAFAAVNVMKIHQDCRKIIADFCGRIGRDIGIETVHTARECLEVFDYFVLDGMYGEVRKTVTEESENRIAWEISGSTHESVWAMFEENFSSYLEFLKAFADGLFESSGFKFSVTDERHFEIIRSL